MKWAFLDRLKARKNRTDKVDVKKTRKRYNKARLLDLLCTIRNRSVSGDAASCLSLSSTTDAPFSQLSHLTASLSELLHYHSIVLRRPIPVSSFSGFKHECVNSWPVYCPTCQNVVVLLPQKRRSRVEEAERECSQSKRIRSCLNDLELANLRWQLAEGDLENRGHFNPTYEAHRTDNDGSIYSEVYDTAWSDDSSTCSIANRPKLVGVRRNRSDFRGSNQEVLEDWLLTGSHTKVVDRTYATVYVDEVPSSAFDQPDSVLPGEPWSSSTLKRRPRQLQDDDRTVYDEVASELDDSFDWSVDLVSVPSRRPRLTLRRRLSESPDHPNDHVKRVRREYFVCEE
ncbi:hypothetical protein CRM22_007576 [Opisthorchis felineus]|uniref:Uncharacterized protein n=1 Tax=Opisthorchis felineus TaxID=147828 RepID=A0A4S2LN25_OPIFE|nr:hypothetical protein CRM22_007576 [Opisthorchis felineus]